MKEDRAVITLGRKNGAVRKNTVRALRQMSSISVDAFAAGLAQYMRARLASPRNVISRDRPAT